MKRSQERTVCCSLHASNRDAARRMSRSRLPPADRQGQEGGAPCRIGRSPRWDGRLEIGRRCLGLPPPGLLCRYCSAVSCVHFLEASLDLVAPYAVSATVRSSCSCTPHLVGLSWGICRRTAHAWDMAQNTTPCSPGEGAEVGKTQRMLLSRSPLPVSLCF